MAENYYPATYRDKDGKALAFSTTADRVFDGTTSVAAEISALQTGKATAAQGAEADALVAGTTPAGNATKLQTARKIGNASFDGTADTTLAQIGVLGSMCFTELWINPSPTADFAAQTISIPRSSYDTLAITSENGFLLLDKDGTAGRIVGMYIDGTGNSVATLMTRDFSYSATSITFNDCKALTSPWASGTTKIQNELNIPKRIYGVNFAKEV